MSSPALRALVLRLFGLLVFALAALGAVSLVADAVAGPQSLFSDGAIAFSKWVSSSVSDWAAVLVGVGLVVLALIFVVIMIPYRPSGLPVMRTGADGKTMLDLSSVAQAVETSLRAGVDNKITVGVTRGRLRIVTPFVPSRPLDLVDSASTSVKQQLQKLGLENLVRYDVTAGRETKRRVQ